ncbi:MAG: MBL fold metallo-hydrolase [Deltaproteobacteria bacterium]|nr:MBL fold metallo-hydrolase [Deltaproteobacteria bacterium]
MRVCLLASGSKGNCIFVSSEKTSLLIDAGLSGKSATTRMAAAGISSRRLAGILVSHEHTDHTRGLGVLSRMYNLPVYVNAGTRDALPSRLGKFCGTEIFTTGQAMTIGDLTVHPFSQSHDAVDPVGFVFEHDGVKVGLATDLGVATRLVTQRLQGCAVLILESNHDPKMLDQGPYPWDLKQRVKGRQGQLSNHDMGELLTNVHHPGLQHLILAHLSEINNTPQLARTTAMEYISALPSSPQLHVAAQDQPTPVISAQAA